MTLYKRGGTWWFHFLHTHPGESKPTHYQKSGQTGDRDLAAKRERNRRVEIENSDFGIKVPTKKKPDMTLKELFDMLEKNWTIKKPLSPRNKSNLKIARASFDEKMLAKDLTDEMIQDYQEKHLDEKYAPATINRALQILATGYKLAIKRTRKQNSAFAKIVDAPDIEFISEEGNVRQGFFEQAEFDAVHSHLPDDLKDFAFFAYITGWRKGEVAAIRWSHVIGGEILIPGVCTKNRQPRKVVIDGQLTALMERRKEAQSYKTPDGMRFALHVFHRKGLPIIEFRKAWASACKKGGVNRLFHDLRRSFARNAIRAGVDANVVKDIGGWKTDAMFKRYNLTSEGDLRKAMQSVEKYSEAERAKVVAIAQVGK
jgi:integrase